MLVSDRTVTSGPWVDLGQKWLAIPFMSRWEIRTLHASLVKQRQIEYVEN